MSSYSVCFLKLFKTLKVCGRSFGFESCRGYGCQSLVSVVCCQVRFLPQANSSSRGILPSVVCLSVIMNTR